MLKEKFAIWKWHFLEILALFTYSIYAYHSSDARLINKHTCIIIFNKDVGGNCDLEALIVSWYNKKVKY